MVDGESPKFYDFFFNSYDIWHQVMSHDPCLLAKMLLLHSVTIPSLITNSPIHCELVQESLRINKSQILDFIAFYKMSQLFWIWGSIIYTHYNPHMSS